MIELKGKYTNAKVFTDNLEDLAREQVIGMLNHKITDGANVRIMPDVHAGKGSTIGTTIALPENFEDWKVCPNVVGVDIGCSIMMYKLNDKDIDLDKLDNIVNEVVPAGFNVHQSPQNVELTESMIDDLTFNLKGKTVDRIHNSLGTLGGGNHFIELGKDGNGDYWLSVHSGSRGLGVQVATHHQNVAIDNLKRNEIALDKVIDKLKTEGRHSEIQKTIESLKKETPSITKDDEVLAYLEDEDLLNYLLDMKTAQDYAHFSRKTMLDNIVDSMGFTVVDKFDSVHNFIEIEFENNKPVSGMIRKGATSAKLGERLVIPLNMRDGSIIAKGKGNSDWNESAPHGAGRMMSRTKARNELSLDDFHEQMKGIHSSSIGESTLDEAPDAYKPAQEIIDNIGDTVEILHIVKPVYNFKAE